MRAQAFSLTERNARPGGRERAFWLPTTTSRRPMRRSRGASPRRRRWRSTTSTVSGRRPRPRRWLGRRGRRLWTTRRAGRRRQADPRRAVQSFRHSLRRDRIAPFRFEHADVHAMSAADVYPPLAEVAGDEGEHRLAARRTQDVRDRGVHSSGAGAREDEDVVGRLEERLQSVGAEIPRNSSVR